MENERLQGAIQRRQDARKGEAGRILIVAGDARYPGAAAMAGMAALRAGCDSVHLVAPAEAATRIGSYSPELVTVPLEGKAWSPKFLDALDEAVKSADLVLVGPGFGVHKERAGWLNKLLPMLDKKVVIDADATKQVYAVDHKRAIIIANQKEHSLFREQNKRLGSNVLVVKGPEDLVRTEKEEQRITGGHPRATVNGTGDVLAGIAAAFYVQLDEPFTAACAASAVTKEIASLLGTRMGYGWLATDMITAIPEAVLKLGIYE